MIKKNICLFIDTFHPGGAERVCVNYANELTNNGYSVTILTFNLKKKFYLEELNSDVIVDNLDVKTGVGFLIKLAFNRKMISRYDLYIAFNHQIAILLYFLKIILFLKPTLIARNVNNLKMDLKAKKGGWLKRTITKLLMSTVYSKINFFIAQCIDMKKDMIAHYGIPDEKIIVINNPISQSFEKLDIGKKIDLLFVGRLKAQKGIDNLIKIMKIVSSHIPNVSLHVVGEGELEEKLLVELAKMDVKFTHERKSRELLTLYNESRITLLTSLYEGYPNVLVESIACGTPVISFDCKSGPREIIVENVNGYLIENFNIEVFANTLINHLKNPFEMDASNNNNQEVLKLKKVIDSLC